MPIVNYRSNRRKFMNNFTVIAEIGCTHIGSLDRAKKLAKLAKISGADVVKTQKRNPKESTNPELWNIPHPNEMYSYGKTYLEHRENVELPIEDHYKLKKYCNNIDIIYSTSIWDMTSAREIVRLNPKIIKIPSACNDRTDIMKYLFSNYDGEIHISTGMLTAKERNELYGFLVTEYLRNRQLDASKIIIYHCTSGYPVPFSQLYLKEIIDLDMGFFPVGFSNHGYGIAMEPVAYALGARYFERHFIDDRMFPHTDASCSLEPQGMSKLVRDLKAVSQALQLQPKKLDKIEQDQKDKLRSA
jgi:N-acetylneuraminate synthase